MISTTMSGSERNNQMYPHARLLNSQEEESLARASRPPITTLSAVPIRVSSRVCPTPARITGSKNQRANTAHSQRGLKATDWITTARINRATTAPTVRSG